MAPQPGVLWDPSVGCRTRGELSTSEAFAAALRGEPCRVTGLGGGDVLLGAQRWVTELALKLNGETLSIDHGSPCRIIAPARPGVLQTKWVRRLEAQA